MERCYGADLAYIHDVGFGDFAREAAPGILEILAASEIHDGLIVDLGCGSGIWAERLLAEGYGVLGIDASSAMIALARRSAPGARFRVASLHDTPIPNCSAVTALGEAIGYLPPSLPEPRSYAPLFRRIAKALSARGLFIFDVILKDPGERLAYRGWTSGDDWAVLVDVEEDTVQPLLRRDITTFRKIGDRYRRSQERHWVQIDRRETILHELSDAGFSATTMRRYGSRRLLDRRLAFCARKRGV